MTGVVFRDGLLLDGLGSPPIRADVVVRGNRIASVSPPGTGSAGEVLDIGGLAIAPGFIDMHTHSDLQILSEPTHEAKVLQGITTEVLGQDGLSYAPVDEEVLTKLRGKLRGWNGDPDGFDWSWRSVQGYLNRLDAGTAVNTAYLVPHGNLRLLVVGDEDRPATADELHRMAGILRDSLRAGAVGMSAGLTYTPGMFADTAELIELCRVVAQEGGYFCPHHRNYGARAMSAYAECIQIARASGVPVHLAHAHLSFGQNHGRISELLAMFDSAIAEGIDLTFDSYPYLAGMSTLQAQLPGWSQIGTAAEQLAMLGDQSVRQRLIHELEVTGSDGHQGVPIDWSTVVISGVAEAASYSELVGMDLAAAAARLRTAPATLCFDLLIATGLAASCVIHVGIEEHVRALMAHPRHTVGSDGILVGDRPHPRAWGTFPRILGRYVREEQVLDLSEAVRHMTSSAADRLGAIDRGRIVSGAAADLVVFDPEQISDRATYDEPRSAPIGVHHVLVNGAFAVREAVVTGARAGRVLRRAKDSGSQRGVGRVM